MKTAAFAIFDVGKTNKKLLLFDEEFLLLKIGRGAKLFYFFDFA